MAVLKEPILQQLKKERSGKKLQLGVFLIFFLKKKKKAVCMYVWPAEGQKRVLDEVEFSSSAVSDSSQLPVTLVPIDSMPYSGLCGHSCIHRHT